MVIKIPASELLAACGLLSRESESDPHDPSTWSTQELKEYEQYLYDREVAGDNTRPQRDVVLVELNARRFS